MGEVLLQRADLLAQLQPRARAARARLRAPGGRERRHREGSEDLRAARLPHPALPRARHELLPRQPQDRGAPRGLGQRPHGAVDHRLLLRLRVHRVAHAPRRFLHRQPHVPVGLVPAPARAARAIPHGLLDAWRARRCTWTTSSRSSRSSRRSCRPRIRVPFPQPDPRGLHVRGRGLPLSGRGALGGAQPHVRAARGRGAGAGGRERRGQDHAREAALAPLRPGRGTHPARRRTTCASTTCSSCAATSA